MMQGPMPAWMGGEFSGQGAPAWMVGWGGPEGREGQMMPGMPWMSGMDFSEEEETGGEWAEGEGTGTDEEAVVSEEAASQAPVTSEAEE